MKTGIFIDEQMTARKLLESFAASLTDQYGKNYYRLEATMEQVGEETFVVHFDNDEDVPEYLTGVRKEFLANKHFSKENLPVSEPGKDFLGAKLTIEQLPPGTRVVLTDGNEYTVTKKKWDGVFVNVDPAIEGGLKFHQADIANIRLIEEKSQL